MMRRARLNGSGRAILHAISERTSESTSCPDPERERGSRKYQQRQNCCSNDQ
jgi:hypothetical protein